MRNALARTIAIELHKINEFREIGNLPLHKVGKYLIPLLPIETEEQVYAIYEVPRPHPFPTQSHSVCTRTNSVQRRAG